MKLIIKTKLDSNYRPSKDLGPYTKSFSEGEVIYEFDEIEEDFDSSKLFDSNHNCYDKLYDDVSSKSDECKKLYNSLIEKLENE